jgi:hypothetical protein
MLMVRLEILQNIQEYCQLPPRRQQLLYKNPVMLILEMLNL